ncbi:MAG: hypothetical protein Q4C96_10990 [Planctomycetia bacterium]|nr:hypothetical protein [Planctomycetia bacterium]
MGVCGGSVYFLGCHYGHHGESVERFYCAYQRAEFSAVTFLAAEEVFAFLGEFGKFGNITIIEHFFLEKSSQAFDRI